MTDEQVEEELGVLIRKLWSLMQNAPLNTKQDRFLRTAYRNLGMGLVTTMLKRVGGRI